jgi:hypothetical protein
LELLPNMDSPFEWDAPDLQDGGVWFEASLDKLRTITEGWRDQKALMLDKRRLLASYRLNYISQGAQRLEILWWECPPPALGIPPFWGINELHENSSSNFGGEWQND